MNTERLRVALAFALRNHWKQKDRSGSPYIHHCLRVATDAHKFSYGLLGKEDRETVFIVGVLHDVIEDTDQSHGHLVEVFGQRVADLVALVSKNPGVQYQDYIDHLCNAYLGYEDHITVLLVKLADLRHNLDVSRYATTDSGVDAALESVITYMTAVEALEEKLKEIVDARNP